jgi:transglutaminase-like putative cysteine protease
VATAERIRPAGVSPGSAAFVAAWLVAGAIARLTGTPVVIALMAGLAVAVLADALGGWLAARRTAVHSIVGPTVTTVDTDSLLTVEFEHAHRSAHTRISTSSGPIADLDLAAMGGGHTEHRTTTATITGRFPDPGVFTELRAALDVVGPLGLVWWRRSVDVRTDPIHVAPVAQGPMVTVTSSTSPQEGLVAAERGNHHGDVDGVRPWREGDAVGAVHWASSMRAGELIVHDRAAVTDERWVLDLDAVAATSSDRASRHTGASGRTVDGGEPGDGPAAQVRWTLDEGLRRGHEVVVMSAGVRHVVGSDVDAARWSARAAQACRRPTGADRTPFWKRPVTAGTVERDASVGASARWTAAGAALASLATLVGGLAAPPTFLALLVVLAIGLAIGTAGSLRLARRTGRRPPLLHAFVAAVVVLALIGIAIDARDVDGLLAVLRGPMPNLLVLLVVLHGFEVVDRRTLRVHQAITFVVAAYAAGLRIDDALGWWLGMWAVAFFTSLLLTTRTSGESRARVDGRATHPLGPGVGVPPRTARRTRLTVRRIVRPLVWIAASVAATLALLSVIPVPDGPTRLGLPALSNDATTVGSPGALAGPDGSPAATGGRGGTDRGSIGGVVGYPGFTETLDTSIRGDLGDEIVMRVRAPEPAFWRGQTFTEFDGRTWTVSPEIGQRSDGPIIEVPPTLGDPTGSSATGTGVEEFVQTYFIETDLPNLVYAASRPRQVIFDGALWTRPDGALRSEVTLTPGSVYTVVSDRIQVTAEALRAQGDLGEVFRGYRESTGTTPVEPFLDLAPSTTSRTVDLATSLRGDSTYDTILAYQQWLATNTQYDLDAPIPPDGADAVDDFLFESRLGYCEQIASTLVIMLRSQGVPARLATGYVPGERDRVAGVWKVRASDAHAWVEVWFPLTGWEAFDPTADVPLAGDVGNGTVGGDLIGATVSSVVAYRLQLLALAAAAVVVLAAVRVAMMLQYRRRRGRWGVLQDRFTALAHLDDGTPPTNPARAAQVHEQVAAQVDRPADAAAGPTAGTVADMLDRVAFDPTWVDDDETFERTRAAVATLERRAHSPR